MHELLARADVAEPQPVRSSATPQRCARPASKSETPRLLAPVGPMAQDERLVQLVRCLVERVGEQSAARVEPPRKG
jgi:hypothetical protein